MSTHATCKASLVFIQKNLKVNRFYFLHILQFFKFVRFFLIIPNYVIDCTSILFSISFRQNLSNLSHLSNSLIFAYLSYSSCVLSLTLSNSLHFSIPREKKNLVRKNNHFQKISLKCYYVAWMKQSFTIFLERVNFGYKIRDIKDGNH